jgi:hypothetical protein
VVRVEKWKCACACVKLAGKTIPSYLFCTPTPFDWNYFADKVGQYNLNFSMGG